MPIVGTGGGCFAYDYRDDPVNPPIVFINSDEEPSEGRGVVPVASSFSEALGMLRDDA